MLGPHLTRENVREVLARAKHRTKKEIAKLVRILDPLPAVPARIEALGPSPLAVVHTHPTWAEQVASFCPVRELLPGDRPADWIEEDKLSVPERIEAPLVNHFSTRCSLPRPRSTWISSSERRRCCRTAERRMESSKSTCRRYGCSWSGWKSVVSVRPSLRRRT